MDSSMRSSWNAAAGTSCASPRRATRLRGIGSGCNSNECDWRPTKRVVHPRPCGPGLEHRFRPYPAAILRLYHQPGQLFPLEDCNHCCGAHPQPGLPRSGAPQQLGQHANTTHSDCTQVLLASHASISNACSQLHLWGLRCYLCRVSTQHLAETRVEIVATWCARHRTRRYLEILLLCHAAGTDHAASQGAAIRHRELAPQKAC